MNFTIKTLTLLSSLILSACADDSARPATTVAITAVPETSSPAEFMAGGNLPANLIEEPVRVAIMLPLSGDKEGIGKALLGAASMALLMLTIPELPCCLLIQRQVQKAPYLH